MTYLCGKNFYAPIGEFKSVSAKELSYIYKDLLGAIMVVETEGNLSLKRGDIILKMNGKRIERLVEFYYAFQNKHTQNLDILRDGKRINVDVQAQEITNKVVKFNQNVIEQMCKLDKKECRRKD